MKTGTADNSPHRSPKTRAGGPLGAAATGHIRTAAHVPRPGEGRGARVSRGSNQQAFGTGGGECPAAANNRLRGGGGRELCGRSPADRQEQPDSKRGSFRRQAPQGGCEARGGSPIGGPDQPHVAVRANVKHLLPNLLRQRALFLQLLDQVSLILPRRKRMESWQCQSQSADRLAAARS